MKLRSSTKYVILHIILCVSLFLDANCQKISQIGKVDPGTCDAKSRGKRVIVVDSKDNDRVLFCVKNNGQYIWRPLDDGPTLGEYFNPVRDCSEIVLRKSGATNGYYWIRTVGLANITKVWCDVKTDGGGFMLVGHIDTPHTWNVTSNSNVMFPSDKPRWSSTFGSLSMMEFRIQFAVINNSQKSIVDWTYRFKNPRRLTELLVDDRGCTKKYPGIGDIEYVKDLLTNEILTKNFLCSQFGPSYPSILGWKRMNKCLGKTCTEGYAIIPGIGLQYDNFGSFSYSVNSQRSGITGNSSAFIGCDLGKCCACFGPKGRTDDSCLPGCRGTVSRKAQAWFWIRSSIPEYRFMKKWMEYLVKTDQGNIETHFIAKTGILTKGSCKTKGVANLIDGIDNVTKELKALERRLTNVDLNLKKEIKASEERLKKLTAPKSCADWYKKGERTDGIYKINPDNQGIFKVRCDMTTGGGVWTLFQRRLDGSVNFYRGWSDYKNGFGDLNGEFWLGLDKLHRLSRAGLNVLRVDLEDFDNQKRYAQYGNFSVSGGSDKYRLAVGSYSGNAGNSLAWHNGMRFTTKDEDNDRRRAENCATSYKGAWWYNSCHHSNLNGLYLRGPNIVSENGVSWTGWRGSTYSLKKTELKIRPRWF